MTSGAGFLLGVLAVFGFALLFYVFINLLF